MNFSAHWPDRLAGIGDIDILGDRKPISYLRQAVFGIGHAPSIGASDWIRQELKSERHHGCGRIILQAGHGGI